MVGDRWRDIDCGFAAGCRTIFIDHSYNEPLGRSPDYRAEDLSEAADLIVRHAQPKNRRLVKANEKKGAKVQMQ